jgi:hypothetical protein
MAKIAIRMRGPSMFIDSSLISENAFSTLEVKNRNGRSATGILGCSRAFQDVSGGLSCQRVFQEHSDGQHESETASVLMDEHLSEKVRRVR